MTRLLMPLVALLLLAQPAPAAERRATDASTPQRTLAQNAHVDLPVPPPEAAPPAPPPLQHIPLRRR